MDLKVPQLSLVFMGVAALAGLSIPVLLFLIFRKKYKADIAPFFIGCAVFAVFALLLEGTINRFILMSGAGRTLQGNTWLFAAFGGLMAGIFEETGRFTAFKTVLKKKRGNDANALMYGAGHGGFEAFFILCVSMVSNIVMAVMMNAGMTDKLTAGVTDAAALRQLNAVFAALSSTAPATFLVSIVERVAAVILQISLSVLVWFAAKDRKRFWLFPLAVLLHAFVDAVAVVMARSGVKIWMIEGVIYVIAAACAAIAITLWKKYARDKDAAGLDVAVEPGPAGEGGEPRA